MQTARTSVKMSGKQRLGENHLVTTEVSRNLGKMLSFSFCKPTLEYFTEPGTSERNDYGNISGFYNNYIHNLDV